MLETEIGLIFDKSATGVVIDKGKNRQDDGKLMNTDAGTGFIHESFYKDDATDFTREWFAWQNSLFGELIVHLVEAGKLDLLNSISAR